MDNFVCAIDNVVNIPVAFSRKKGSPPLVQTVTKIGQISRENAVENHVVSDRHLAVSSVSGGLKPIGNVYGTRGRSLGIHFGCHKLFVLKTLLLPHSSLQVLLLPKFS